MNSKLLYILLFLGFILSGQLAEGQIRVINNKGTISTIDTNRAITGVPTYLASPEQYTLSTSSAVQSGTIVIFTPTSANTTTAPLLKAGTQSTAVVITKNGHQALVAGDIAAGVPSIAIFDGTNWVLQTPQGTPTGSVIAIGTPSASYSAGASLSGNTLTMGLANATNPGIVSTSLQTFTGQKQFNSSTTVFGMGEGGTPTTTFIRGPQAGGSGTAGADLYIQASNGTGAGGSGNIIFQTATAATISTPTVSNVVNQAFGNSISQTLAGYTVPSAGTNKVLMVEVNLQYAGLSVSSVTYNGTALSSLGYITSSSNKMEIWYLIAPVAGSSKDIVVTLNNYGAVGLTAMTWSNVNQTTPFGAIVSSNNGYAASVSLLPASSLGQVVMDFLTTATTPVTATAGQSVLTSFYNGSSCYNTSGYKTATAGSTTMSYSFANSNFGYMAFAINPSSTGGSNALSDALKINNSGNTVLASGRKMSFTDNSSGTVSVTAPASVTGSYTLTLPTSAGSSNQVLTTDGSGNLSWTMPGSLPSLSATSPLNYNSGTFSINQASSSTSGYLSSTDWTTFNNKLSGTFTSLTSGDFLKYNGTNWVNAAVTLPSSTASAYSIYGNNTASTAAPTYFTPTLASALFSNQGTATTVLHGNAGGNPLWGAVILPADVSGTLPVANGGTGLTTITANNLLYASAANTISGMTTTNNGILVTSPTGIPSIGNTVGAALTMPSLNLSGSSSQVVMQSGGISGTLTWTPTTSNKTITLPNATGTVALTSDITTAPLAGDVTGTTGATVVGKINGTSLAGLATGILKNTTTTGVPSIAVAVDFPTLNQNTTGTANNVTGTVAVANGGTGLTTITANNLLYASAANTISGMTTTNNGILVTSSTGVPSIGNTVGATLTMPSLNLSGSSSQVVMQSGGISGTLTWTPTTSNKTITLPNATGTVALTSDITTAPLAGDVTGTTGATVVGKINGTSLAGLATGILKNTTTTGVPSIAVAVDFPTLNQNTTGTANNVTGIVLGANGGTGVANTGMTITLGGNLTTSGANATTLTTTGATNVTLPTSGTLYGTATGSISSTQLSASLSDETGTGSAVFSASPTFTGTPTLPTGTIATTKAFGDNTTALATTAFVQSETPTYSRVTSTVTNLTTTLTDITGLSFAATTNAVYEFEAVLSVQSSTTNGNAYAVNYSAAGATVEAQITGTLAAATQKTLRISALNNAATPFVTAVITGGILIKGIFTTGANAGNFTIQHYKVTSGTSTVFANSFLKVTRIQ